MIEERLKKKVEVDEYHSYGSIPQENIFKEARDEYPSNSRIFTFLAACFVVLSLIILFSRTTDAHALTSRVVPPINSLETINPLTANAAGNDVVDMPIAIPGDEQNMQTYIFSTHNSEITNFVAVHKGQYTFERIAKPDIEGTMAPYHVYYTVTYEERRSPGVYPRGVHVEITFTSKFGGPNIWLTATYGWFSDTDGCCGDVYLAAAKSVSDQVHMSCTLLENGEISINFIPPGLPERTSFSYGNLVFNLKMQRQDPERL